ncbi:MAG: phosphoribosyltransferase [Gammaproteobacteria bacterium]|nr:phosphoribosyltransferase [Gammaproteobacteria bacterium]
MIKLIDILEEVKEGVKLGDDYGVHIDVVKQSDDLETDDFVINRSKQHRKVNNVPVYYGFSVNPKMDKSEAELTTIFNNIKKNNRLIKDDELYKLVLLTAPSEVKIDRVVTLYSSSDLNERLAKAVAKKYKIPSENESFLFTTKKKLYKPKDMIDRDAYERADPTTRKMADTFVRCLEKKFGPDKMIHIKKSGYDGSCGIQSGGRRLLNPTYDLDGLNIDENSKILIVDDFLVSGSSFREVFISMVKDMGVPAKNIYGYTLALK